MGAHLGLRLVPWLVAASALCACAAGASEPDPSRPWEICIPVTTAQAAAYAAANPLRFQGGAYRSTFFAGGARVNLPSRAYGAPTRRAETPANPPPPIPLPAAGLLLASALAGVAAWKIWRPRP